MPASRPFGNQLTGGELTQKGCYQAMDTKISQKTRTEVLAKKRDRYARANKEHKTKIINEVVELFDCHRKAAIRALQDAARWAGK